MQSISHTVIPAAAALYLASLSGVWLPVYRRFGSDVKTEGMWQTWHVIFHSPMAACDIWRYYKVLSARLQWSVRTRSFSRCFTGQFRTCVSFQLDCEGWYRGILVYAVVLNDHCVHTILLSNEIEWRTNGDLCCSVLSLRCVLCIKTPVTSRVSEKISAVSNCAQIWQSAIRCLSERDLIMDSNKSHRIL